MKRLAPGLLLVLGLSAGGIWVLTRSVEAAPRPVAPRGDFNSEERSRKPVQLTARLKQGD
jgi:hypothetical protein